VTVGLATHWPCVRLCGLSTYELKAHVREMSTRLISPLGMASLYLYFTYSVHNMLTLIRQKTVEVRLMTMIHVRRIIVLCEKYYTYS